MIGDLFDNPWKVLLWIFLFIVLFGARKLPDAARQVGKTMRILKTEMKGLSEDDELATTAAATAQSAPTQLQAPAYQAPAVPTASAVPDPQTQLDALSKQLADLQQSIAANKTDSAQAS